jgi:hypothetical protein
MRLLLAMAIFAGVAYWQFGWATSEIPTHRLARPAEVANGPLGKTGVLPGMPAVPLESQLEANRITVYVFSGRWCPACRRLDRQVRRFGGVRPDVAFKFIETNDHWRAKYNIVSVPHIIIFDAQGSQVVADRGSDKAALHSLTNWMNEETQKAFDARR